MKKTFILAIILVLLPVASAEILLSQTDSVYNIRDSFNLTITLLSRYNTENFLSAKLICDKGEIEIYKSPIHLTAGENKLVSITSALDKFLIGDIEGDCHIKATFGEEEALGQVFTITKNLDVSLNIEGVVFSPKESVKVYGGAQKANGGLVNGYVEVSINEIGFAFSGEVIDGKFNFDFVIPEKARSGSYEIQARVYEKDSSNVVTNEGIASNTIKIKQVPASIGIAFDTQSIKPRNELKYTIIVYDQADEHAQADVSVSIFNSKGEEFQKKLISSDETNTFFIESNFSPGHWKIDAGLGNLQESRAFFVEEFPEVSFALENQILTLTNTGNVPYSNFVEIKIGEISEVKEIKNLQVGESKQFKLAAPDGEYSIKVGNRIQEQDLGQTFLTGKAISVTDVGALNKNLIILVAVILVLIIAILSLVLFRKFLKRRKPKFARVKSSETEKEKTATIIDKGEKQESSVISIKINNPEALRIGSMARKTLDSALWKAKEQGGKVYVHDDFRIIVFAPVLTKEKENSIKAITVAQDISRILSAHNKRYQAKIDFGIAVNSGDLIVESKEGKFKFISVDRTIMKAKRLSQESKGEVLIPEDLHRKTVGKVKAKKISNENWKIEKVVDRSMHEDYINKFKIKQLPR